MSDGLQSLGAHPQPLTPSAKPFTLFSTLTLRTVGGTLELLSIGILETDPSEARVQRSDILRGKMLWMGGLGVGLADE